MSIFEKIKVGYKLWKERAKLQAAWGAFKRYVPLVSGALIVTSTVLKAIGKADQAEGIESVGKLLGLVLDDPELTKELILGAGLGVGVFLKFKKLLGVEK